MAPIIGCGRWWRCKIPNPGGRHIGRVVFLVEVVRCLFGKNKLGWDPPTLDEGPWRHHGTWDLNNFRVQKMIGSLEEKKQFKINKNVRRKKGGVIVYMRAWLLESFVFCILPFSTFCMASGACDNHKSRHPNFFWIILLLGCSSIVFENN